MKFIKNFGLKKTIKKSLAKYQPIAMPDTVVTVGVLTDEQHYGNTSTIVKAIVKQGIAEKNIEVLSYRENISSKEVVKDCYSLADINANGRFKTEAVNAFVYRRFDMLISYYDTEDLPLVLATLKSKAKFKVGFSAVDTRLNDFTINTPTKKYELFVSELFKYIKILNRK
ncbi:DUF6913 domain-containing protein [Flavobacterium litorale]|uniref:Uncharacterized protein n=1 Tax=Flavobacterium litorale TaxID=2856519 RepID=A0ABX8V5E5_9FLAO|nr:hypothetical protein [Flavobacterium litorale]QYJ68058.1 hypothetical protein K1I41_11050 [Flavobacterium litorale]